MLGCLLDGWTRPTTTALHARASWEDCLESCDMRGMGRPYKQYLRGKRVYVCSCCKSHIADHDDIISKVKACEAWVTWQVIAPSINEDLETFWCNMPGAGGCNGVYK